MADYTQPDYVDRRVRFFNNQFLVEQDLIDEQKYHVDRERRLIKHLHTPGIVAGLDVTISDPSVGKITVAPGTAIDDKGRQIVLPENRALLLSVGDPAADHGADVLPFQPPNSQPVLLLVISYAEVEADPATVGSHGSTRWQENPVIALKPEGSPDLGTVFVVLGRLSLNVSSDNKVTINAAGPDDQKVRVYAGLKLGGPLTVNGKGGIGASAPAAPLEIRNPETNLDNTGQILRDPAAILRLYREGVPGKSWPDIAQFSLSRYANPDPNARTQLDIGLTNGADNVIAPIMSLRSDGSLAVGTTTAPATLNVTGISNLNGNVTVGAAAAPAALKVNGAASDASNGDLFLGDPNGSHLRLGHHGDYSWIQSYGSKPLALNPLLNNNVGICTTAPQAPLEVRSAVPSTSGNSLQPGTPVLRLYRDGVNNIAWSNVAQFSLSRYENAGTTARSRLDIGLNHGDGLDIGDPIMSLRSDGRVGIGMPTPDAPLEIGTAVTNIDSGNKLKPPEPLLRLYRPGISGLTWPNIAEFSVSRFADSSTAGTAAKTELGIGLSDGVDNVINRVMTLRSDGTFGFALAPFNVRTYGPLGDNINYDTGYPLADWTVAAIIGFDVGANGSPSGMSLYTYVNSNNHWWIRADLIGVNENWTITVMFVRRGWAV